jgi:hypothetical protein
VPEGVGDDVGVGDGEILGVGDGVTNNKELSKPPLNALPKLISAHFFETITCCGEETGAMLELPSWPA